MSTLVWFTFYIAGLLAGCWLVIKGAEESGPSAAFFLQVGLLLWVITYSAFWVLIWLGAYA